MKGPRLKWSVLPPAIFLTACCFALLGGLLIGRWAIWLLYVLVPLTLPGFELTRFYSGGEEAGIFLAVFLTAGMLGLFGFISSALKTSGSRWLSFVTLTVVSVLMPIIHVNIAPSGGRIFQAFVLKSRTPQARAQRLVDKLLVNTPQSTEEFNSGYSKLNDWEKSDVIGDCSKRCSPNITVKLMEEFVGKNGARSSAQYTAIAWARRPEFVPLLEKLAEDPDDAIREAAACQLAQVTGKLYSYRETNTTKMFERHCDAIGKLKELEKGVPN